MAKDLINRGLVKASIKLNMYIFSLSGFIFGGFSLFLATLLSSAEPDNLLNILVLFLPGYSVSTTGAWLGLLWGGFLGALSSALLYKVYARNIAEYVEEYITAGRNIKDLENMHVMLNEKSLGLVLGAITSLSLFISTNYLVYIEHVKGVHVEFLSKLLPHYDLSFTGSLYGAVELFVVVFIFCFIVSVVYNKLAGLPPGERS